MGASYRVVWPYVTIKVTDANGAPVVAGFNAGAVLSDIDAESLKGLLTKGAVEKVGAAPTPDEEDKGGKAQSSSASSSRSSSSSSK